MPFDPKLIPAADAPLYSDGELNLPDDLTALANQLRDDATHLATAYRPNPTPARNLNPLPNLHPALSPSHRGVSSRPFLHRLTAACVLLIASLTATVLFWPSRDHTPLAENIADESTAEAASASPPPTAISFTELSSPELEALLDLVQRQPDSISVSY